MPTPTPAWNLIRVFGTWNNMDGTKKAGSYRISNSQRITSAIDDVIIPPGTFASGTLNLATGPSIDVMVPAVDDPDISPTGFSWVVEVAFNDKTATETFYVKPLVASGQVNLRQVVVPSSAPALSEVQYVGVPGGLAKLDADGDVVDADGIKVISGGGGGGPINASQINDSTAIGRALVTAASSTAARSAIGAGTSSLALGTTGTTAKAGDYQPTVENISNATAIGRTVLKAADAAAARTAIGAVPAADLEDLVQEFLELGVRVDQLLDYNDSALNTKLAALPVGTVVGIVGPEVA